MTDRPTHIDIEFLSDACFPVRSALETDAAQSTGNSRQLAIHTALDAGGFPFVPARVLLGQLRGAWARMSGAFPNLMDAASRVLSLGSADGSPSPLLRIGDAQYPSDVMPWMLDAVSRNQHPVPHGELLRSLTVRRQLLRTAPPSQANPDEAAPMTHLDCVRTGTRMSAPLYWLADPSALELRVLAMCCLASRHAGVQRMRGMGHVRLLLSGGTQDQVSDRKQRTAALALAAAG